MTVIRPNAIAGITSLTAQTDNITFHKSDGTLAGLLLEGVNFNTTSGVSTFANVSIADSIVHTEDTDTSIRFPAADTFTVETAGSERLRIDQFGRLGIGTISPSNLLTVSGGGAVAKFIGSGSDVSLNFQNATSSTGYLQYTADNLALWTNGTERLRITSTGDVVLAAGQTVGSSAGVVTYFGDGSNLTGIAAGGSGTFDTGITTSIIVPVTAGIGTNDDTNRDIFVGPGIAYSFPSTASTQYVIESIHVVNKSGGNLYLSGRHDINGGDNVPIANRVAVPYNGAVELLEQPHVANLSDVIRLQALTGTGTSATGANNGLDAFITYSAKSDSTDYIGVAQTITSTDQEFFEVASNPCVVQSLNLVNYSNNVDVDVSISIFSGGTTGGIATTGIRRGYLAYNITVPRNSTIELCEKPKRLESNQALLISASSNNQVGVLLSGKYITS